MLTKVMPTMLTALLLLSGGPAIADAGDEYGHMIRGDITRLIEYDGGASIVLDTGHRFALPKRMLIELAPGDTVDVTAVRLYGEWVAKEIEPVTRLNEPIYG